MNQMRLLFLKLSVITIIFCAPFVPMLLGHEPFRIEVLEQVHVYNFAMFVLYAVAFAATWIVSIYFALRRVD